MGAFGHFFEGNSEGGVGAVVVVGELISLQQFGLYFGLAHAAADGHDDGLPLEAQHPRREDSTF